MASVEQPAPTALTASRSSRPSAIRKVLTVPSAEFATSARTGVLMIVTLGRWGTHVRALMGYLPRPVDGPCIFPSMSSKTNAPLARIDDPSSISNVVLVGSSGSGKTTLFEHLVRSNVASYRGEKEDLERSSALQLAAFRTGDVVLNLLDAPGHPDFVGELRAALRAADAAVFVVAAGDGIDAATAALWHECTAVGMPRAIVVTKLDDGRTTFDVALADLQSVLGKSVQPGYVPLVTGGQITGNLSLVSQQVHDYSSGSLVTRAADAAELGIIEQYRSELIEGIIEESEDADLMDRYLEGDELKEDELLADLLTAILHGRFHPVIGVNSLNGIGTEQLLTVIENSFPQPGTHRLRVTTPGGQDIESLSGAVARLAVEDTTVRLERTVETDQIVLWTMGQGHVDLLLSRLVQRYGVKVTQEDLKVPLRETFISKAAAQGRHVKQSGGHGQYAVCQLGVEPLERGSGFEFVDKVVGGSVPRQFIPSVEKGVRGQLEKGVLAGYPLVDVRVTLVDGKSHSVDSSDMAFQTAGSLGLREAANAKTVTLLEPIDEVVVTVGEEYMGAVMTDVSGRRGHVLGTDSDDAHHAVIRALIPQSELSRYAIDLRGLAHGSGSFTRSFHGYEQMPQNLVDDAIKAHHS